MYTFHHSRGLVFEASPAGPVGRMWRTSAFYIVGICLLICHCRSIQKEAGKRTTSSTNPDVIVVNYATANPKNSAHVRHINKFKELLEIYSDGKMTLKLHVGGVMGSEQDNVMDVSSGDLHMSTMAVNNITSFTPIVGFMTLPYMFISTEKARRFLLWENPILETVGAAMIQDGNLRPLGWLNSGYRVLSNSKRVVRRPADLSGLKIRVPENPIMVATYRAWGVEPIPLPWTKTYEALENGVIDAQDNPYISDMNMPLAKKPFFKIQKYITDLHYILLILVHIVNEDFYQSLPADLKQAVLRAARGSTICLWDWVDDENQSIQDKLLSHGMVLTKPADEEREWKRLGRSIWPQFYERIGGRRLVDSAVNFLDIVAAQDPAKDDADICLTPIQVEERQQTDSQQQKSASLDPILLGGVIRCPYLCDPETGRPGFLMEIARAAFEPTGHEVEYKDLPWSRAIMQAKRGEIAGLIGALRRNVPGLVFPKEEQAFTKMRFFVAKNYHWKFQGLVSLHQMQLGVIQDFSYGELDSYIRKNLNTEKVQALSGKGSLIRNIQKLKRKRITAIVEDDIVMRHTLDKLGQSEEVVEAGDLTGDNVYIAFSQEHPNAIDYADLLSRAMRSLRASGQLAKILQSYGLNDWKANSAGSTSQVIGGGDPSY